MHLSKSIRISQIQGASVLSHAIRNIPAEQINRQATQTLTNFFLSKLSDHTLIAPTLEALTTLAQLQTFRSLEAKNVCTALFDCLKPPKPQFIQAVRYLYYQLLDLLLHRHRGALKSLGGEFVSGYIHTIQGEKDPRNLMLVFGMNRVVLIEFDTRSHTEVGCFANGFSLFTKTPRHSLMSCSATSQSPLSLLQMTHTVSPLMTSDWP